MLEFVGGVLTFGLTFAYPAFLSFKEINTQQAKWLTYWVLHTLLCVFELNLGGVCAWIPAFPYIKLGILVWLWNPTSNGAEQIYKIHILKNLPPIGPALKQPLTPQVKATNVTNNPMDVLSKADRFLATNGYVEPSRGPTLPFMSR